MIESDDDTELACLYNDPGCTGGTAGDWVSNTHYPIIDNGQWIANLFDVGYYPTIYHVCQNRIITEPGTGSPGELAAVNSTCQVASGMNNVGILNYKGFSGAFCGSETFTPTFQMQNLGTEEMTSVTAELWLNGVMQEKVDWTGSLETYGLADVSFSDITVEEDTDIEITIPLVNGVDDDAISNNSVTAEARVSLVTDQSYITLELRTDQYGVANYWELLDGNGNAFYSGGNAIVVGGTDGSGAYSANSFYTEEIPLPGDGCYEFVIYDFYEDGLCCSQGNGYYRLVDQSGNVILQGGQFEAQDSRPFRIDGSVGTPDNGAIVFYSGGTGQFCGETVLSPSLTMQNLGGTEITQMEIELVGPSGVVATQNWIGSIETGQYGIVSMGSVTITETPVTFNIVSINGAADEYAYKNSYSPDLTRTSAETEETEYKLELKLDQYAYEVYWQMQSSAGDILASGGNQAVGLNGGGLGPNSPANPNSPGAYPNYALVEEDISAPAYVQDCYEFYLVDGWGDGLVDGGGGYVRLIDPNGNYIFNKNLNTLRFAQDLTMVNATPEPNATNEISGLESMNLFPNPVNDNLNVQFSLAESMPISIAVYNVLGQQMQTVAEQNYVAGSHNLNVDVSDLNAGVYYLRFSNDGQQKTQKFTVVSR